MLGATLIMARPGASAPRSDFEYPLAIETSRLAPDSLSHDAMEFAADASVPPETPHPSHAFGIRADRWQHASLSFALAAGAGAFGAPPAAAFGISFGFGAAKECIDRGGSGFDPLDLAADLGGALLGALLVRALSD